jgi:hypothetical protein
MEALHSHLPARWAGLIPSPDAFDLSLPLDSSLLQCCQESQLQQMGVQGGPPEQGLIRQVMPVVEHHDRETSGGLRVV